MRTDLLSKRMFTAGCFGLPWLWIVHAWYWKIQTTTTNGGEEENGEGEADDNAAAALLNADDHFPQDATGPTTLTPEEIKLEATKWVHRCQYSAMVVCSVWLAWIVTSQVLRVHGMLPASLFMLNSDDQAVTGW